MPLGVLRAQEFTLAITGKDSLETQTIDSVGYQNELPSFRMIQTETDTLLQKLQHIGYIDAVHGPINKKNDSLFGVRFSLGGLYKRIKIYYSRDSIDPALLKPVATKLTPQYFVIPISKTEKSLRFLNKKIADNGMPFASLWLSEIKKTGKDGLAAHLNINYTRLRTIDSIVVKGYEKFPRAFLKNFIRVKKGQVFNKSRLDKKAEAFKNLRFVSVIRPPAVLFAKDKTTLYFYLKKQNSNRFEGFLGFSTDKDSKKLQFNGDISVSLVNNLNFGEALHIAYKNNGNGQRHFNAKLKLPYLFSTPFGLELGLDLFRKDSAYTISTQTAKLTYSLTHKIELDAGYQSKSSTALLDDSGIVAGQDIADYSARFFTIGGDYTYRNAGNPLFPIRTELRIDIGLGKRVRDNSASDQQRIGFNGSHIFPIDRRNSIYVSNQTAVLFSADFLENELFRFGGINSIRGFEENSLSASFYSSFQTEYRYLLSQNLYANTIMDYARMANGRLGSKNNLYGIGFGLGLKIKAGLLKVAFANGKTDGQTFKFKNTKVHVSLTAIF